MVKKDGIKFHRQWVDGHVAIALCGLRQSFYNFGELAPNLDLYSDHREHRLRRDHPARHLPKNKQGKCQNLLARTVFYTYNKGIDMPCSPALVEKRL